MRRKLYDLKNKRAGLLGEAKAALEAGSMEGYNAKFAEATKLNDEIAAIENLMAEEGRFDETDPKMVNLHDVLTNDKAERLQLSAVDKARAGNDYANAFAKAIAGGETIKTAGKNEAYKPLMNALSIGGGTPAGADGGFLVPIEFDNMIHLRLKEFIRLADFFNTENVTGITGWRAIEKSKASKPLPVIDELGTINPDDQPSFEKVTYNIKKYGDVIPVSSELADDNTAGLMQYLADWFTPKVVLTENALLLALLNALTATALTTGNEVKGLKQALNKGLNTAYSKRAKLICNQDSYNALDELTDTTGRGLLVPDVTNPDVYRFKGRGISYADNDLIPTVATAAPIFIGDFKSFGTLFRRKALEFAATTIGGNAWRSDSTEVRGIVRMDAVKMIGDAATKRTITVSE
ncbi:MAG: phage major capsid protein [Candidatus Fimivivens sp.]|nr:phage major capsid protein [Candidatus Fimivivens sp.]